MIPIDISSRGQLIKDSQVQAPKAVTEVSNQFPALVLGQRITARITDIQANGVLRAEVDGKLINLTIASNNPGKPIEQLNGIGPGQTLQLVVTGEKGRTVLARQAEQTASEAPLLSKSAQIISDLLGKGSPQPAALAKGAPLMQAPTPESFRALPQQLRQAVAESGLFYESHQAQWVAGKLPAESLLREPQGGFSPLLARSPGPQSPAAPTLLPSPTLTEQAETPVTLQNNAPPNTELANSTAALRTAVFANLASGTPTNTAALFAAAGAAASNPASPAATEDSRGEPLSAQRLPTIAGETAQMGQGTTPTTARFLQGALLYQTEQARWDAPPSVPPGNTPEQMQKGNMLPSLPHADAHISQGAPRADEASPSFQRAPLTPELPIAQSPIQTPSKEGSGLLPADLQPLVQQQLEAADTRQLVWQGQVWPGQDMEWRVEEETHQGASDDDESPRQWNTSLRLVLPHLGELKAALTLNAAGVAVTVTTDKVDALRPAAPALSDSLAAAGLSVLSVTVAAPNEQT